MFQVLWDNGHACDTFRTVCETREEAEQLAKDWKDQMVAEDDDPEEAEEVYSWEIIPARLNADGEPI